MLRFRQLQKNVIVLIEQQNCTFLFKEKADIYAVLGNYNILNIKGVLLFCFLYYKHVNQCNFQLNCYACSNYWTDTSGVL